MQQTAYQNTQTITAEKGLTAYLQKVWRYRQMVRTLSRRDLKMQYAQTLLGILWSAIQPLTGLVVFTFFFQYVFKIETGGMPYPLLALTGIVPWYYFTNVIANAGTSLVDSQDIIRRLYFPRLVLPLSKSVNALVELVIGLLIYTLLAVFYGVVPGVSVLLLPIFVGMLWVLSLTLLYATATCSALFRIL